MPNTESHPATGAPTLERKTFAFEVKALGDGTAGNGSFTIYAAAFGNIDRANEKIEAGAFKNLPTFVEDGFMAVNHDWKALPVGTIDSATQDDVGLLIHGEFHSHPEAQACRTVMRERLARRKSVKLSIGYTVNSDTKAIENGKPYRLLTSIDLYECSFVNVPANERAVAVAVKGSSMSDAATKMSEGDDESGGATVPGDEDGSTDAPPVRRGQHVQWGKKKEAKCGTVMGLHTKGTHGGFDASTDSPVARMALCKAMKPDTDGDEGDMEGKCAKGCGTKCMMTKDMAHAFVSDLKPKAGTPKPMADEDATDEPVDRKPEGKGGTLATKGQYLGDTDEVMTAAALDRLISITGYYLFSCIYSDKPLDVVLAAAGGAIDEFRATAIKLMSALLEDEADEADDTEAPPAQGYIGSVGSDYGRSYGSMSADALSQKYLAKLASLDTSRSRAVAALSLADRSREVVSAIGEIRDVSLKHFAIRLKEGRTLSTANRSLIQTVSDDIAKLKIALDELLASTAPKPKEDPQSIMKGLDAAAVLAAQAEFALVDFQSACNPR